MWVLLQLHPTLLLVAVVVQGNHTDSHTNTSTTNTTTSITPTARSTNMNCTLTISQVISVQPHPN